MKAKGIEITLVHHETHPHGAPGEGSQLGVAFPLNLEIDAVSVDGRAIFQGEPWSRLYVLGLQLHAQASNGACAEIQFKLFSGEDQGLRQDFGFRRAGVDRMKPSVRRT